MPQAAISFSIHLELTESNRPQLAAPEVCISGCVRPVSFMAA